MTSEGLPTYPRLDPRLPLRDGWVWAFTALVDRAIAAASEVAPDPGGSVHDFRRALRGARAVLALARPAAGRDTLAPLAGSLATATRATAALRDEAVLPSVLARVALTGEALAARTTLAARLLESGGRVQGSETIAALLEELVHPLEDLPDRFLDLLPARLDWIHVERGLRLQYKRARGLVRTSTHRMDDDACLHRARKRVKELRDQLGLFVEAGGGRVESARDAMGELSRELGEVTDRVLLRDRVRARMGEMPVEISLALLSQLQADLLRQRRRSLQTARRFFRRSPRAASSRWVDWILP